LPNHSSVKPRQLPVIEEAWNLPISAEMAARAQQQLQHPQPQNFKQEPSMGMTKYKTEAGNNMNNVSHEENPTTRRRTTSLQPMEQAFSPPFSPNFTDQDLQLWLSEKNLPDDLNFDELDFEFNNNFDTNPVPTEHQVTVLPTSDAIPTFNITMSGEQIIENAKGLGLRGVSNCSILENDSEIPCPPECPKIPLTSEQQLLPQTMSVYVSSRRVKDLWKELIYVE
jgi:hypothetical protein